MSAAVSSIPYVSVWVCVIHTFIHAWCGIFTPLSLNLEKCRVCFRLLYCVKFLKNTGDSVHKCWLSLIVGYFHMAFETSNLKVLWGRLFSRSSFACVVDLFVPYIPKISCLWSFKFYVCRCLCLKSLCHIEKEIWFLNVQWHRYSFCLCHTAF